MTVSFDWEFEEDQDARQPDGHKGGPPNRRRRWLGGGAVLGILLLLVGLWVRAWINNRLDTVARVEEELRGIAELELENIADGDGELFRARQDPTDARWQARQVARYISGPKDFVPAPGLIPAERPPEVKVHVIGRTGRAELVRWFELSGDPLPFHTTWFYHLNEDGEWYHVAPPDDYWGVPYTWYGSRLVVRATEVEAELLDPVVSDLTGLIARGCDLLDCSQNLRYTLRFYDESGPRVRGRLWTLPALYLTGLPRGNEARAAWLHALKLWMVESLAQAQLEGADVTGRVLYRRLVARLQVDLDLSGPGIEQFSPDVETLTQAVTDHRTHTLQELWEAEYADDPQYNRLLDAQVTALFRWITSRAGERELFQLLPALAQYRRLDAALMAVYQFAPLDFEAEWQRYLFDLTGVAAAPLPAPTPAPGLPPLEPPPPPPAPPGPPGDQIAFVCGGRVWVGNADGSGLTPLTAEGQHFGQLRWSPDGRWLVTAWQHDYQSSLLYLLAADGSGGRLLIDDPAANVFPVGWSPDGRQVIYYLWQGVPMTSVGTGIWAVDMETGATRQLESVPLWSPDGQRMVYLRGSLDGRDSAVWLADAGWENARQIVDRSWIPTGSGMGDAWSPDGSRLALALAGEEPGGSAIAIYDLATETVTPLVTAAELTEIVLSYEGDFLTDGADPATLVDRPLQSLLPVGWSSDGQRLAVWAQATTRGQRVTAPSALAVVPLDGSPPRVLAYGSGGFFYGGIQWSPADPRRLTLAWQNESRSPDALSAYLFDLEAGPVYTYTATNWLGTWSPDGAWTAFAGPGQVNIVDPGGKVHFSLKSGADCLGPVWNPQADLSALGRSPVLEVSTPDWSFSNYFVYQAPETGILHVWGELVNYAGAGQRISTLNPILYDEDGVRVADGQDVILAGHQRWLTNIDLVDGRGLPFGLMLSLPDGVSVAPDYEILLDLKTTRAAGPTREDLDVVHHDFDLTAWPDHFYVSGIWENPGEELLAYVAVVVTVYDEEGRVIGGGWHHETEPAYLSEGSHYFNVEVEIPAFIPELEADLWSYKVQLFGR